MITIEEYYVDGATITQVPAMSTFNSGAAPKDPATGYAS
jgi:hypothetical protein